MHRRETDVAILGAGTAGLAARREAHRAGARTLLIESGPWGTTCARVGCMPSKLLIAAADAAHAVARAGVFGIEIPPEAPRIRGGAVLERVRRERDRFVDGVLESVETIPEEERLQGEARFVGPTALAVGDDIRVEARAVVIATGSRPRIPPQLEALRDRVRTSDDVFELDALPESVAVMGTGALGLEIGQALGRLGVRVAFFTPFDELGPFTDPVLREAVREILGRELDLHLEVDYEVAPREAGGFDVRWGDGASASFERLLAAAGRVPNLEALDLERTGLPLDDDGAPRVDPHTLQWGDGPVFVAGDVNGQRPFLHEANDEGGIAGANAAHFPKVEPARRRTPLSIVFTDPQMAMVGEPWRQHEGRGVATGGVDYAHQGRARVIARDAGCVRLYAERDSGRLRGAEMLGPGVEHTAHLLAWAIQAGLDVGEAYALPFYHPVLEEGIRTALRDACEHLELVCRSKPGELEHGPAD